MEIHSFLKTKLLFKQNQQPNKKHKNLISPKFHQNCPGPSILPLRSPTAPAASKWPPLPPWLLKPARRHPLPRLHGIRSRNWWSSRPVFSGCGWRWRWQRMEDVLLMIMRRMRVILFFWGSQGCDEFVDQIDVRWHDLICGKAVAQYGAEGRNTKKSKFSLVDWYGFVLECVSNATSWGMVWICHLAWWKGIDVTWCFSLEKKREKQKFNLGLRQKCAKSFTRVNRGNIDVKAEFFKLVPGAKMEQIRNDLDKEYRCLKFHEISKMPDSRSEMTFKYCGRERGCFIFNFFQIFQGGVK